jgi:hypothetical protein
MFDWNETRQEVIVRLEGRLKIEIRNCLADECQGRFRSVCICCRKKTEKIVFPTIWEVACVSLKTNCTFVGCFSCFFTGHTQLQSSFSLSSREETSIILSKRLQDICECHRERIRSFKSSEGHSVTYRKAFFNCTIAFRRVIKSDPCCPTLDFFSKMLHDGISLSSWAKNELESMERPSSVLFDTSTSA